jgi:cell wall assembly regulator SMI1/ankyrin repeat protein
MNDGLRSELDTAITARDPERLRAVLAKGPDLEAPWDEYGVLPTYKACAYGPSMVEPFLEHGVDVNAVCHLGQQWTLLLAAASLGRADLVKWLLDRGADIHRKDKYGLGVIDRVSFIKHHPTEEMLALLLDAGVDVNHHGPLSPLMSCDDSKLAAAKLLIARGANVNFRSSLGTALTNAVDSKSKKLIELLLNHGADPNLTTAEGSEHPNLTPLEYARALKHKGIVALLEEKTGGESRTPPIQPLAWGEFAKAVKKSSRAERLKALRGPAAEADIQKIAKAAGGDLPGDYRNFLTLHDGQDGGETIVGNPERPDEPYQLLSCDEIAHGLAWFKKNAKSLGEGYDPITADDGVKAKFWNAKWVPIAQNGAGDFLCLDLAPAKRGMRGQIILFDHEAPHRSKISDSFGHLLAAWLATQS